MCYMINLVLFFLVDSKEIESEQKTGNENPGNNSNKYQINFCAKI